MAFTPKIWVDLPSETTPIDAASLSDLETRVTTYADTVSGGQSLGLVVHDGDSWPARPVGAAAVMWIGPTAPAIGGIGAADGVDMWVPTVEA